MKIIKMRYSIEPRDRIYVKGYGFLSFAKHIGRHANKVAKSLSNKYSQKFLDSSKKSRTDAIKTASKRLIQEPAEAIGDLIRNKIANKITRFSKKSTTKLHSKESRNDETDENVEIATKDCVISSATGETKFKTAETKVYFPVVTLSTQDNARFLQQLKSGFKKQLTGTNMNRT